MTLKGARMKIRIRHATSLSVKIEDRVFAVLIDGDDETSQCWVSIEERGKEKNGQVLSQHFATLEDARTAWDEGFTIADPESPSVKRVVDELIAQNFAEVV